MGYFGELHLSDKLPSPELLPIENIQAVHQELGQAFEHNTGAAESLEHQLNKIKLRDNKQHYINDLSKEVTEEINKVRDNPFEMPYANKMIRNLANEKYANNKELHAYIKDKKNEEQYYAELSNLRKGYTMINEDDDNIGIDGKSQSGGKYKKTGTYSEETINTSMLITKSLNQKEAIYNPETDGLENSFNGYKPVVDYDISEKLIDNISKLSAFGDMDQYGLTKSSSNFYLQSLSRHTLSAEKVNALATMLLSQDPHYKDWVNQKVLFEKVANTERDENGLLKFDENGEFLDIKFKDKAKNNPEFLTFLKLATTNIKIKEGNVETSPISKEIGDPAENEEDFNRFINSSEGKSFYYDWIRERESANLKKLAIQAFVFDKKSISFVRNEQALEAYKSGLKDAKTNIIYTQAVNSNINITPSSRTDTYLKLLSEAEANDDKELAQAINEKWLNEIENTIDVTTDGTFLDDLSKEIWADKYLMEKFKEEWASNKNLNKKAPANDWFKDGFFKNTLYGGKKRIYNVFKQLYDKNRSDRDTQRDMLKVIREVIKTDKGRKIYDKISAKNKKTFNVGQIGELVSIGYSNENVSASQYIETDAKLVNDNNSDYIALNGLSKSAYMNQIIEDGNAQYFNGKEWEVVPSGSEITYESTKTLSITPINGIFYNRYKMKFNGKDVRIRESENSGYENQISLGNSNQNETSRALFNTFRESIVNTYTYYMQTGSLPQGMEPANLKNQFRYMVSIGTKKFEAVNEFMGIEDYFKTRTIKVYDYQVDNYTDMRINATPIFNKTTGQLEGIMDGHDNNYIYSIDNYKVKLFLERNPHFKEMAEFCGISIKTNKK